MKELTIEQKAKAYDEAFRIAQELYNDPNSSKVGKGYVYTVFPELKESEDEKIRKTLIRVLNENVGNGIEKYGAKLEDALAWLEKQDKQNPCETCEEPRLNCQNFPCEKKKNFDFSNKVEPKFHKGEWITIKE